MLGLKAFADQRKISIYVEKHQANHEYIFRKENCMKRSSKMKCNSCGHGICQVCGGCHHPDCKKTARPLNACFNQLLTPELSQTEEKYRDAFMVAGFTNDQWEKVYNVIKIERSDAQKEALKEMKAAVEFANVAPDKVGTFKDGHDTLKAQVLYLLRSKLGQ
jgi:hypothetical protein